MSRRRKYGCGCGKAVFHSKVALDEHQRLQHGVRTISLPHQEPGERPEPLPPPPLSKRPWLQTPEFRAQSGERSKAKWASYTPEQRAARVAKIAAAIRARYAAKRAAAAAAAPPEPEPVPVPEVPATATAATQDDILAKVAGLLMTIEQAISGIRTIVLTIKAAPLSAPAPVAVSNGHAEIPDTEPAPVTVDAGEAYRRLMAAGPAEKRIVIPRKPRVTAADLHRNLGLRDAIRMARDLGVEVRMNSAAEWEFRHPLLNRRVRANTKRHDCPRALLTLLRQVAKGKAPAKPTVGRC